MAPLEFSAEVIEWRGPAPFFYARLPLQPAAEIARVKSAASYGWGVIPVIAEIAGVSFTTSLFPRDGTYYLPLKDKVRRAAGITLGDEVAVRLEIGGTIREPK